MIPCFPQRHDSRIEALQPVAPLDSVPTEPMVGRKCDVPKQTTLPKALVQRDLAPRATLYKDAHQKRGSNRRARPNYWKGRVGFSWTHHRVRSARKKQ